MTIEVTISQAVPILKTYLQAGLVPMIEGSPGIGKSAIVHQLAQAFGLKLIDFRLSQAEPTDFCGFPDIVRSPNGAKAGFVPMDIFPLDTDPIPDGYNGWLIFLDEMNSGNRATQAAAYKLVLDRMVGNRRLHKNVAMVAAGNKESDGAIVEALSTALQSRLVHLSLKTSLEDFSNYASANNFDSRITSYMQLKPDSLYTFKPDHTDKTYACPRTWEFTDRLLKKGLDVSSKLALPTLAGTISEGIAMDFLSFCRLEGEMPKLASIVNFPDTAPVPEDLAVMWALTGHIAEKAVASTVEAYVTYLKRAPVEFQVFCIRDMGNRNKGALKRHPAIVKWLQETGVNFF